MKTVAYIVLIALLMGCNSQRQDQPLVDESSTQTYNGPIIDMHIHAFVEGDPMLDMLGVPHPPTLRNKTYPAVSSTGELKEKTLEKFRQHNIVKAMVTNGGLWKDGNDDRIMIGAANKGIDNLRDQFNENNLQVIAEMAPFYAGIRADDPSLFPYYELAQELDIPVGLHILPGGPNYGFHLGADMLAGMRARNADPLQLEPVLVNFPNLKLYIMHAGWPYVEDVKALMYMHPNLYVDIAVINWILPQAEFENHLKALIDAGFGNRILYGSDQMLWPKTIDDAIESVNSIDFLSIEQKEDIFYDNAAEFLDLSDEVIKQHKSQ